MDPRVSKKPLLILFLQAKTINISNRCQIEAHRINFLKFFFVKTFFLLLLSFFCWLSCNKTKLDCTSKFWQTWSRIKMSSKTHLTSVHHLRPSTVLNCWTNCINLHLVIADNFFYNSVFHFNTITFALKVFIILYLWHFQHK